MRDQQACATGQIAPFMQNPQTTAFVILTPQIMVEVLKESGFNSSVGTQIGLGVCVYINSTSKVGTYLITSHFNISGRGHRLCKHTSVSSIGSTEWTRRSLIYGGLVWIILFAC